MPVDRKKLLVNWDLHLYILYSAAGCGPIGLISAGIAKSMGAVKMYIILLDVLTL